MTWKTLDALNVRALDQPVTRRVPACRRLWAPKRWRGHRLLVIHPHGQWRILDGLVLEVDACEVNALDPPLMGGPIPVTAREGMHEVILAPIGEPL